MSYKNPPKFESEKGANYEAFKKEASIWSTFTDLKPEQKGPALFLCSLEGTVRDLTFQKLSAFQQRWRENILSLMGDFHIWIHARACARGVFVLSWSFNRPVIFMF